MGLAVQGSTGGRTGLGDAQFSAQFLDLAFSGHEFMERRISRRMVTGSPSMASGGLDVLLHEVQRSFTALTRRSVLGGIILRSLERGLAPLPEHVLGPEQAGPRPRT